MNKTIIYITNNKLDKHIEEVCKKNILESIGNLRLISVSQKPIEFGENICVGELPHSSLSINIQMMEGLKRVKTDYIAIAEHDCLYTKEHFYWTPPDKNTFWYNENVWCLQTSSAVYPEFNGMFSFLKKRKANSQLIVGTEIMKQATQDKIEMMSDPTWFKKYPSGRIGEAGAMNYDHAMRLARGESIKHIREKLKEYVFKYKGENFRTKLSNIDIRHKDNFTKNKRGTKRTFKISYWGTIKDIL